MERAKGFEPSAQKLEVPQNQGHPNETKGGCTQLYAQISGPCCLELSYVVAAWSKLSRPLQAAILAIVAASPSSSHINSPDAVPSASGESTILADNQKEKGN